MHRVQIVNKGFHGLIGSPPDLLIRIFLRPLLQLGNILFLHHFRQPDSLFFPVGFILIHCGPQSGFLFDGFAHGPNLFQTVFHVIQKVDHFSKIGPIQLLVGFFDPVCHSVIKVGNALSPVLVILIGLNSNAGQGGIALDIIRFPQVSVSGGKPPFEKFLDIDLAAGGGQGQEIQVMDMDVPGCMG